MYPQKNVSIIVFSVLFLSMSFVANAAGDSTKTKFIHAIGVYGSVNGEMTWVKDNPELFVNGSVGIILNKRLYAGPYIFTQLTRTGLNQELNARMTGGGGMIGYFIAPKNRLHVDINLKVGLAKMYPKGDFDSKIDRLGVIQPEVTLNYTLTDWCKLRAGVGYRFHSDVFEPYFETGDLNAFTLSAGLFFGKF